MGDLRKPHSVNGPCPDEDEPNPADYPQGERDLDYLADMAFGKMPAASSLPPVDPPATTLYSEPAYIDAVCRMLRTPRTMMDGERANAAVVIEALVAEVERLRGVVPPPQTVRVVEVHRKGERFAYVCEDGFVRWADMHQAFVIDDAGAAVQDTTAAAAARSVMLTALRADTSWCDDFGNDTLSETARRLVDIALDALAAAGFAVTRTGEA